jgi:SAM-dependent methyltransferase
MDLKAADPLISRLFRLVCAAELEQPTETLSLPLEYLDNWFQRDYAHIQAFFRRLEGRFSVEGKAVLEVGSGLGPTCIHAALNGARRVVGVEIVPRWLEFALFKVNRDSPRLTKVIEFRHSDGSLTEIHPEKFDVIISHDSFEHYSDPEGMVGKFIEFLRDDGVLVTAFSPLWKSSYGGHIDFMTKFPWAHLLFPERIIMAERRRLLPSENTQRFEDAIGGLNRMTLARFRKIMRDATRLECIYFETNVSQKRIMTVMRLLSRIPLLEEFFTQNVYSMWRLKR